MGGAKSYLTLLKATPCGNDVKQPPVDTFLESLKSTNWLIVAYSQMAEESPTGTGKTLLGMPGFWSLGQIGGCSNSINKSFGLVLVPFFTLTVGISMIFFQVWKYLDSQTKC